MTIEKIIKLFNSRTKNVGLKVLYAKLKIPKSERYKWMALWDLVHKDLEKAKEKQNVQIKV